MWERGVKHVIIHWWKWPEQMDGTSKVFLYGMKSSGFGMSPLSSDSSAISRRARTATVAVKNSGCFAFSSYSSFNLFFLTECHVQSCFAQMCNNTS